MSNKDISYTKIAFITLGLIIVSYFGLILLQRLNIISPSCTVSDVYTTSDWSECSKDGFKTRVVVKNTDISCLNPGKVIEPESSDICTYRSKCSDSQIVISQWSECIDGLQKRIVEVQAGQDCVINFNSIETERLCENANKNVTILKDYTTQIDLDKVGYENGIDVYGLNNKNLNLQFEGKFKDIQLNILADTSYKIPEYYYFRFEINRNTTRTIGTNRTAPNRLNLSKNGIFKGTNTPISKEFDLNNLEEASLDGKVSLESTFSNYVNEINSRKSDVLQGTLYIGDGRSMLEEDVRKRIYATILEAKLVYECAGGSVCNILNLNQE